MASIRGRRTSPQPLPFLLGETRVPLPCICLPLQLPVCLSAGVFLLLPEGLLSLELLPSSSEVLLKSNENFTVVSNGVFIWPVWLHSGLQLPVFSPQVCSGWSQVSWLLPQDTMVDGVAVEDQGSISILSIVNATWKHSGRYLCEEGLSSQSKSVDIFIPGQGGDGAREMLLFSSQPSKNIWLPVRSGGMVRPLRSRCGDEGERGRHHPLCGVRSTAHRVSVRTSQKAG